MFYIRHIFRKLLRTTWLLLAGLGLFGTGCARKNYTWNTEEEYYRLPIYKDHIRVFKKMNYAPHTTDVFIGDSMTEGFDLKKHLGRDSLVNMGISGDFTSGVLNRISFATRLQPKRIFVMIGINDILKHVPMSRITQQYGAIIDELHRGNPNAGIWVQSNLPTTLMGGSIEENDKVLAQVNELNTFLKSKCISSGVNFIDMYSAFESPDRTLRPELTYDGLHLSESGYEVWSSFLKSIFENPIPANRE